MIQLSRDYGKDYVDNHIDPLLGFNTFQKWNVTSGTGSAILDTDILFEGNSSLKIENTDTNTNIELSNSAQNTVIPYTGDFNLSFYTFKNDPNEFFGLDINIFKNGVFLATEFTVIGSDNSEEDVNNEWVRYQSNTSYTFARGDVVTFTFSMGGGSVTGNPTVVCWLDGMMLSATNRQSKVVPFYTKPLQTQDYNQFTGWSDYSDNTYTTGSPFLLTTASGVSDLPNDAATVNESQKPIDISTFYDGTTITGRQGDGLNITIEFKCRPDGAGADPRLLVYIDIGGVVPPLYNRNFFLNKGNGVEHFFLSSFNAYTLDTWQANGGTVKIQAFNEDIEIYDIRYVLTRTHKAR